LFDGITKLVSQTSMQQWERYKSCFIGVSVWSTLVYFMLKVMNHHEFMNIVPEFRDVDIGVRDPADTLYITLDLI